MAISSVANRVQGIVRSASLLLVLTWFGLPSPAASNKALAADPSAVPLTQALQQIEASAGVNFVYANELLQHIWVQPEPEEQPLERVLEKLLLETGFHFQRVAEDRILLKPQPENRLRTVAGTIASPAGNLPQAWIGVVGAARGALSGANGEFHLARLSHGRLKLRISAPGFLTTTLEIAPGPTAAKVEVVLYPRPALAEQITVSSAPALTQGGALAIQGDWLRPVDLVSRGSVSRDLFHGLATVPGLATGLGEGGISIRGARPAENLVLLEGIKLYEVEHALGHFSAINPDAVGVMTLYKGAFPAEYGDRMAGVLDIGVRGDAWEQREVRAGFDRDLAHATLLTPLGSRASLLLSARQSHSDATSNSVSDRLFAATFNETSTPLDDDNFQSQRDFRFEDQILRLNLALSADARLSFTGFRSRDQSDEVREEIVADLSQSLFMRLGDWGNTGASLRWDQRWNSDHQTQAQVAFSEYRSDFDIFEETEFDPFARGFREETILRKTRLREARFQLEHGWEVTRAQRFRLGFFSSNIRLRLSEDLDNIEFEELEPSGDFEIVDEGGFFFEQETQTRQTGGFFEYSANLNATWRWLVGARLGKNSLSNTSFFEPRISLHGFPREQLELHAAWGRVHQFVLRSPDTINYFEGEPTWFLAEEDLIMPGLAEGYQVGAKYQAGGLTWALDIYRKDQEGSLLRRFNPLRPGEAVVQTAETYEGGDLGLVKHLAAWSFQLGYSYQRTRVVENLTEAQEVNFPTARDRPHALQSAISWYGRAWEASCHWRYASGVPFDVPIIEEEGDPEDPELSLLEPDERFCFRLSSRNQVDVRTSYGFRWLQGDFKVGLSLTNALDRANPTHRFFILDEEDEDLLPVDVFDFGRRWSFDFQVRF